MHKSRAAQKAQEVNRLERRVKRRAKIDRELQLEIARKRKDLEREIALATNHYQLVLAGMEGVIDG